MNAAHVVWLCIGVLGVTPAAASAPTAAGEPAVATSAHEGSFSMYLRTGAHLYQSARRTFGGIGGGVGVRYEPRPHLFVQGDASYLMQLGNVTAIQLAAGVEAEGTWSPAAMILLSTYWGDALTFADGAHPGLVVGPAITLGLSAAPLRFQTGDTTVSVLQLGAGVGVEAGLALGMQLQLLEVSARF